MVAYGSGPVSSEGSSSAGAGSAEQTEGQAGKAEEEPRPEDPPAVDLSQVGAALASTQPPIVLEAPAQFVRFDFVRSAAGEISASALNSVESNVRAVPRSALNL